MKIEKTTYSKTVGKITYSKTIEKVTYDSEFERLEVERKRREAKEKLEYLKRMDELNAIRSKNGYTNLPKDRIFYDGYKGPEAFMSDILNAYFESLGE